MNNNIDNYLTTLCGSVKLQKMEYPLRYFRKNMERSFVELDVFGNAEVEQNWKNWSGAVPNPPPKKPLGDTVRTFD